MMQARNSFKRALTCSLPMLLMIGCATSSPPLSPQSIEPAKIPALPPEARVSRAPIPSICLPTCTAGLMRLREQSLATLTSSGSAVSPPSTSPTDYSLPTGKRLPAN